MAVEAADGQGVPEEQGMPPHPYQHQEMVLSHSPPGFAKQLQGKFVASPVPLSLLGSMWIPWILVASRQCCGEGCAVKCSGALPLRLGHGLCFLEALCFWAELETAASPGGRSWHAPEPAQGSWNNLIRLCGACFLVPVIKHPAVEIFDVYSD